MLINEMISCKDFSCYDLNKSGYLVPDVSINPEKIKILMIAEAMPENPNDYFYSKKDPVFMETTLQAFRDANLEVNTIDDIVDLGFYLTIAVKCAKIGYSVPTNAIKNCSFILEKEINLFLNYKVIMLMGDVAIKAMNYIARRNSGKRAIPSGSTYKIRKDEFYYKNIRLFPSYLITGKNYLIEKSKRRMIAEDITNAMDYIKK